MSHAATEAPPADAGTGDSPPPAERPAPQIEAHPGYATESYPWPDESAGDGGTSTPPADTPAATTPVATPTPPAPETPPAAATPPAPVADPLLAARAAFAEGKATAEQISQLVADDPEIRKVVDDRAQKRAGNLLQQEKQRQDHETEQERKWADIEAYATKLRASRDSTDPAKRREYEEYAATPDGSAWLDTYTAERDARARRAASQSRNGADALTPDAVRAAITEASTSWNHEAASRFAEGVRGRAFFGYLSTATQKALTDVTQDSADRTWVEEWTERIDRDLAAHVKKVRDEALEAGRNEGQAAGTQENPVQIRGDVSNSRLSAGDVLAHHMDYGFEADEHGVSITPEQLQWAKTQKRIND